MPGIYIPISNDRFPKIVAWQKRMSQAIPFFDEMNGKYVQQYYQLIHSTIQKNKQVN